MRRESVTAAFGDADPKISLIQFPKIILKHLNCDFEVKHMWSHLSCLFTEINKRKNVLDIYSLRSSVEWSRVERSRMMDPDKGT